jgi:hypothetical protein
MARIISSIRHPDEIANRGERLVSRNIHMASRARTSLQHLFTPSVANSIAERIWHSNQKLKWHKDGNLELNLSVVSVWDVVAWVLRLAVDADVLAPRELRQIVLARSGRH